MRINRSSARVAAIAVLAVAALGGASASATFDLSWYTIDGGGAMFSTGGSYSLGGTIGQHDAGVMSGGSYTLVGGFWALPTSPALCPGDMNCDGVVNFDDIDLFVEALQGLPSWPYPNCPWLNGDVNGDNTVNFDDIDPFVAAIGTSCP